MNARRAGLRALLLTAIPLALSGCGFSPPMTAADRDTLQTCRSDADRIYNVQNRAQISQRNGEDSPFSGESQRGLPSDGLADRYSHERMVDDCVRHNAAQASP